MTTPEQDNKIRFMQDLYHQVDNNGDATGLLAFFEADKATQDVMYNTYLSNEKATQLATLDAQIAGLEARKAEYSELVGLQA